MFSVQATIRDEWGRNGVGKGGGGELQSYTGVYIEVSV